MDKNKVCRLDGSYEDALKELDLLCKSLGISDEDIANDNEYGDEDDKDN